MRRIAMAALLAACVAGSICQAAPLDGPPTPVAPHGETSITARLGDATLAAAVWTHEVDIGPASQPPPARRTLNCTYSRIPCLLLDSLEIRTGRGAIAIPRSAFGDLSDVRRAQFHRLGADRFSLTLDGGDAAQSYRVELLFDSRRVLSRTLVDREAGAVAEKTTYFDLSSAFR